MLTSAPSPPPTTLPPGSALAGEFNFFPNNVQAFPSAWSLANQTAYSTDLGNKASGGLLTIAVRDYYPLAPVVYFVPGAWCDTEGAVIPLATVQAALPPVPAAHRRALRQVAPEAVTITNPCDLMQVSYRVGANGERLNPPYNATTKAYAVALPTDLPDVSCDAGGIDWLILTEVNGRANTTCLHAT